MSSVINKPAILAVQSDTKKLEINALSVTFVIAVLLSGANDDNAPIIIPIEAGFVKLQIANVAIAEDLSYTIIKKGKNKIVV